ncbi:MAG: response regulator [Candidatus Omnitrophica bacterium]|nr:response regulator [Candidatus Omnitrophota bacterium]MBU2044621.1 response regulator [Candidatus Omnitrophota bacterium]MBU2251533.1 response regulator [Candidatus Omnitrophota bacterium]MBU2474052.1 response regulator [Candidatus Omnitrophota bacterium]
MPKVLVVDDEVEITVFLCNFLKRFDIESQKASDPKTALAAFNQFKPDWVFLDIKMPDKDGFELLEEFKKINSKVKAIMITGKDDKESQDKAKGLGACDYIVKPLDLEELHEKIEKHIL